MPFGAYWKEGTVSNDAKPSEVAVLTEQVAIQQTKIISLQNINDVLVAANITLEAENEYLVGEMERLRNALRTIAMGSMLEYGAQRYAKSMLEAQP